MKTKRCYLYTRVSTKIQVDGYSLDAQREAARRYANAFDMQIIKEYSDEGKSGKNTAGRPAFTEMLDDIASKKDNVDFVLVFKLSRFGRNAADSLNSLQLMQDYGVNLICIEDGIDSSKEAGKLLISILSAVAEQERENIKVQTMAGREQKAREGKWNGGFAPYGYQLVDGKLEIAEDEAEVIKIIFDKFVHTTWGAGNISKYLNDNYKKKVRQNGSLNSFSAPFVIKVIDNPIYMGKLAYGRRRTEKIDGTRNEFKVKKQDEFPMYEGIHEAIVSEELWNLAQEKRKTTAIAPIKKHSLDHEHLLSGIVKCPRCGKGMYGNVNRKKKKDGTLYKDHFYYACKHRAHLDGHPCDYRKQWNQTEINGAVEEVILKLVHNDKFAEALKQKINTKLDLTEIEKEIQGANCKCKLDTCTVELRESERRSGWKPQASVLGDAAAAFGCVNRVEELVKQFLRGAVAKLLARPSVQFISCSQDILSRESLNGHTLRNNGSKQPVVAFVLGTFPRGVGMRKVDCTAPALDLTERREL